MSSAWIPKEAGKCGLSLLLAASLYLQEVPLRELVWTLSPRGGVSQPEDVNATQQVLTGEARPSVVVHKEQQQINEKKESCSFEANENTVPIRVPKQKRYPKRFHILSLEESEPKRTKLDVPRHRCPLCVPQGHLLADVLAEGQELLLGNPPAGSHSGDTNDS